MDTVTLTIAEAVVLTACTFAGWALFARYLGVQVFSE